jgi:P27 family predicted phage terminase small subunit
MIVKKVLTAWDVDLFAAFCTTAAMYHRAWAEVESNGTHVDRPCSGPVVSPAFRVAQACLEQARSLAASYGLTPADRGR